MSGPMKEPMNLIQNYSSPPWLPASHLSRGLASSFSFTSSLSLWLLFWTSLELGRETNKEERKGADGPPLFCWC